MKCTCFQSHYLLITRLHIQYLTVKNCLTVDTVLELLLMEALLEWLHDIARENRTLLPHQPMTVMVGKVPQYPPAPAEAV